MHQPDRPLSPIATERLWRAACDLLASRLELSDATVAELSAHARDLRWRIPAARLAELDAERLSR